MYINWSIPNFITVCVMGALGYMLFGSIASFYAKSKGSA